MKIGDYVRTKNGTITEYNAHDIILNEFENRYYYIYDTYCEDSVSELVIKSSPNIIDLIEVGDYVNGLKVAKVENNVIYMFGLLMKLGQEDIKSIVTKEQFENSKYEVR